MSKSSQRVYITGGSGFIGSHLVNYLDDQAIDYILLKRGQSSVLDLDLSLNNILLWAGEPSNIAEVNSSEFSQQQVITKKLRNYLLNSFDHVIYLSSASVYEKDNFLLKTEEAKVSKEDNYSIGKVEREDVVLEKPNGCVLRLSNIYGLGMKGNIFNDIRSQLYTECREIYIRNLISIFDLLYVEDLISCLGKIFEKKLVGLYNLSSGRESTPSEIVHNIFNELNIKKIVNETDPDRVSYLKVDNTKVSNAVNWIPKFDLLTGIKDLIEKGYFK